MVLTEGRSKKSDAEWKGLSDGGRRVVFSDTLPAAHGTASGSAEPPGAIAAGTYVRVRVLRHNGVTLIGDAVETVARL